MKKYTEDNFVITENSFDKIQVDSGYWSEYSIQWDINYSDILTTLIQCAGRYCERYASDLFIDWSNIVENVINNHEFSCAKYLFGFCEDGVDGNTFVLSRYNNGERKEYRAVYLLYIYVDDSNGYDKLTMKLQRQRVY